MRFEHYIAVGQRRLRCGYTTGTCAAAATRGAAEALLGGAWPASVCIDTPAGIAVEVELLERTAGPDWCACAVRKDGGDDPDATHGTLIFARVERTGQGVEVDGGEGVGRVTCPGLNQSVGAAAINSVPRAMIERELHGALKSHGDGGGLKSVISAPEGERIAQKTFNPRLGIVGGISILGTSGIVRPMSEVSLIASVHLELDMQRANGVKDVVITPGHYGENFSREMLGLGTEHRATCSNYIGDAIDHASLLGFESLLLVGHIGKLVKVAAGNLNTHSRVSDGRREALAAHTALAGGDRATVQAVFDSPTTDAAIEILNEAALLSPVMERVAHELEAQLAHRAGEGLRAEALFFSNRYGILGKTSGADRLLSLHRPTGKDVSL